MKWHIWPEEEIHAKPVYTLAQAPSGTERHSQGRSLYPAVKCCWPVLIASNICLIIQIQSSMCYSDSRVASYLSTSVA